MFNLIIKILFEKNINKFKYVFFPMPAAVNIERIIDLHHFITFFLIIILILVLWLLFVLLDTFINYQIIKKSALYEKFTNITNKQTSIFYIFAHINLINKFFIEHKELESSWTIFPCVILLLIAIPSFYILYINEELVSPGISLKIFALQWYWHFDHTDIYPWWFNKLKTSVDLDNFFIDSYLIPEEYLNISDELGALRLLEAEETMFTPLKLHLRLLIGSLDTLHSFAIPQFGLKSDCIPGRISSLELFVKRTGAFYGQCSEICGQGHAFMPLNLHVITYTNYSIGNLNLKNIEE